MEIITRPVVSILIYWERSELPNPLQPHAGWGRVPAAHNDFRFAHTVIGTFDFTQHRRLF